MTQDSPAATNTPVPAECNANDAQGCTETFVYRQDGVPLELLYTPAKNNITQRYWYETDAHGSVVALTDASGQVVQRYVYGPWGDLIPLLSGPELVPQPLLYRGYVYDRELTGHGEASGWYWLSVRSYDPNIGRFIQPDPSEQEGTRSYVYCGDAPLDCSDPSGLLSLEDVGNVALAVGVGLIVVGVAATGVGLVAEAAGFGAVGAFSTAVLLTSGPLLVGEGSSIVSGEPMIGGGGGGRFGGDISSEGAAADNAQQLTLFALQPPKTVYRVLRPDEDPSVGLFPKNPGNRSGNLAADVTQHVRFGSSTSMRSRFISTTGSAAVAKSYARRDERRVAEIRLGGVQGEVY